LAVEIGQFFLGAPGGVRLKGPPYRPHGEKKGGEKKKTDRFGGAGKVAANRPGRKDWANFLVPGFWGGVVFIAKLGPGSITRGGKGGGRAGPWSGGQLWGGPGSFVFLTGAACGQRRAGPNFAARASWGGDPATDVGPATFP